MTSLEAWARHELTFFEVVSTGRWSDRVGLALTPGDHALLADFVVSRRALAPRIFSVPDAYTRFGCFAARSWMHVTPAGEVYPCSCYPESWATYCGAGEENLATNGEFSLPGKQNMPHEKIRRYLSCFKQNCSSMKGRKPDRN